MPQGTVSNTTAAGNLVLSFYCDLLTRDHLLGSLSLSEEQTPLQTTFKLKGGSGDVAQPPSPCLSKCPNVQMAKEKQSTTGQTIAFFSRAVICYLPGLVF